MSYILIKIRQFEDEIERKELDLCIFIFFFQAEDGIRYLTVTGVQTCALPISAVLLLVALLRSAVRSSATSNNTAAIQSRAAPTRRGLAAALAASTVMTDPVVPHATAASAIRTRPRDAEGA